MSKRILCIIPILVIITMTAPFPLHCQNDSEVDLIQILVQEAEKALRENEWILSVKKTETALLEIEKLSQEKDFSEIIIHLHMIAGCAYNESGRFREARECFGKALRINPMREFDVSVYPENAKAVFQSAKEQPFKAEVKETPDIIKEKASMTVIPDNKARSKPSGGGHWEFNLHYSLWTLNLVKSLLENTAGEILEDNLREQFLDEIRKDYPGAYENSHSQDVQFDSGGDNYGFEARWYPKGLNGSFSLGLAVERTSMRVSLPKVESLMSLGDTDYPEQQLVFTGQVRDASFTLKTTSYHLSFRWDIIPSKRINPFITFGIGIFSVGDLEKGRLKLFYQGDLVLIGEPGQHYEETIDKSIEEALAEAEDSPELPAVLPYLQINIGCKWRILKSLHMLVDAGIWDGFILRFGLSYRL